MVMVTDRRTTHHTAILLQVTIPLDPRNQTRGFAFVEYENAEDAKVCVRVSCVRYLYVDIYAQDRVSSPLTQTTTTTTTGRYRQHGPLRD